MLKPPILCKKKQDKTSLDRDFLLGRIFCSVGFSARSDLQSDRYKYEHL